jgi:hypothetical protein
MTEIVDELFEHPKARNDDILDAMYYANYFAWQRPPKSGRLTLDAFHNTDSTKKSRNSAKKAYNWITGSRI